MSPNRDEKFNQTATLLGFIVDSATIASWLLSLISAIALASQNEAPRLPGINIALGPWYQVVLLWSAALSYVHVLRRRWINDRSVEDPLSNSFKEFLWYDLPGLKRPLLLIPIFLFFAIWLGIGISALSRDEFVSTGILVLILWVLTLTAVFGLISNLRETDTIYELISVWNDDPELQERWVERIDRKLREYGLVNTEMFEDSIGLSLTSSIDNEQINWAIKMYFNRYELEQDLVLSEEYSITRGENPNNIPVLCYQLSYRQQRTIE